MEVTKESLWMMLAVVGVLIVAILLIGFAPGLGERLMALLGGVLGR